MSDFHGEIYIVDIERKDGVTTARIERNDGKWYDENFTAIGSPEELSKVGEVITADFEARAAASAADSG